MPTFFGRRYMRDAVPRRETVIGAGILVLLVGIVVGFVVHSRGEFEPLFEVAPGNEKRSLLSREQQVAGNMMPTLGTAGWSLDPDIAVLSREELGDLAVGGRRLVDFDVAWVYRGRYVKSADDSQFVSVVICDAGSPRNAFGLFAAGRPDESTPLPLGNEGWRTESGGAFWAGRYYTSFDRSTVGDEQPSIRTIADALAGVQIRYGSPFWAEGILGRSEQSATSFRFERRGALGLEFLENAFLVERADGLTVFALEASSVGRADRIMERFAEYLSNEGTVQAEPQDEPSSVLAGNIGRQQYAAFQVSSYIYGATGTNMEAISGRVDTMRVAVMPTVLAGTNAASSGADGSAAGQSPFPEIDDASWGLPNNVRGYTPVDLWQKINGRADLYLGFGMQRMTFGTYRSEVNAEHAVDVYWYEMGEADSAFGIFKAEASGHAEAIDVGRQGYVASGNVFFWKGSHYLRVEVLGQDDTSADAARAIAVAIAKLIPDEGGEMWAEAMLPVADRVAGSFDYHASDAFGLDFLSEVYTAEYESEGKRYRCFIHQEADAAAAGDIFRQYVAFFDSYGRVIAKEGETGQEFAVGESGGVVDAVFVWDRYVAGVNNTDDAELASQKAREFRTMLDGPGESQEEKGYP